MQSILKCWLIPGLLFTTCLCTGCVPAKRMPDDIALQMLPNPASGKLVRVVKVSDLRTFSADTSKVGVPVMNVKAEIADKTITDKTIGRFADRADVILGSGSTPTVEILVEMAVWNALRADGYSVQPDGSAPDPNAIPIEVEINNFWAWTVTGFWTVDVHMNVEINFKSSLAPNGESEVIKGSYTLTSPAVVDAVFGAAVDDGLENLTTNLKATLKKP